VRRADGYEVDDDPARVDRDAAWAYLSNEAYWGRWRARQDFDAQCAEWPLIPLIFRTEEARHDCLQF